MRPRGFEWTDLAGLPAWCRDGLGLLLRELAGPLATLAARDLLAHLERSGCTRLVDLGAGMGGPWPVVFPWLVANASRPLELELTDRVPPPARVLDAFPAQLRARVRVRAAPTDLRTVALAPATLYTTVATLHHLAPPALAAALARFAAAGAPFAALELPAGDRLRLAELPAAIRDGFGAAVLRPLPAPARAVIAGMYGWDLAVSRRRALTDRALDELCARSGRPGYRFTRTGYDVGGRRLVTAVFGGPASA